MKVATPSNHVVRLLLSYYFLCLIGVGPLLNPPKDARPAYPLADVVIPFYLGRLVSLLGNVDQGCWAAYRCNYLHQHLNWHVLLLVYLLMMLMLQVKAIEAMF